MAMSMRQVRAPCAARRVAGQRIAVRVAPKAVSRKSLVVEATKKSVGGGCRGSGGRVAQRTRAVQMAAGRLGCTSLEQGARDSHVHFPLTA